MDDRPTPRDGPLEEARTLAAAAAMRSAEIEGQGRLPADLVQAAATAGVFQLYLPADCGGRPLAPLEALAVTETLARGDGSLAWCASISSALSHYLAWLDPEVVRLLGGDPPDWRLAGSARPLGRATPCPGGFRVSGRWDFASNIDQARWYFGTCVVDDDHDPPRTRTMMLPASHVRVEPTWEALGLRGTGSHDVVAEDLFVPVDHVASVTRLRQRTELAYHPRLFAVVIFCPTVGVILGLARGALEAMAALAEAATTGSATPLAERADVQSAVGRAEARVGAGRAYVGEMVQAACEAVAAEEAGEPLDRAVARARLAITHAARESVAAVDELIDVAGTAGLFSKATLERRFRDIHVAAHHSAGLARNVEAAGRVLLGLPAGLPYY